jgi:imidazoleglycerol phosphate synthase glutamine amidotransferase subunit HisH
MLGVCLGVQMLLDGSVEFGKTKGLGIISGFHGCTQKPKTL